MAELALGGGQVSQLEVAHAEVERELGLEVAVGGVGMPGGGLVRMQAGGPVAMGVMDLGEADLSGHAQLGLPQLSAPRRASRQCRPACWYSACW